MLLPPTDTRSKGLPSSSCSHLLLKRSASYKRQMLWQSPPQPPLRPNVRASIRLQRRRLLFWRLCVVSIKAFISFDANTSSSWCVSGKDVMPGAIKSGLKARNTRGRLLTNGETSRLTRRFTFRVLLAALAHLFKSSSLIWRRSIWTWHRARARMRAWWSAACHAKI